MNSHSNAKFNDQYLQLYLYLNVNFARKNVTEQYLQLYSYSKGFRKDDSHSQYLQLYLYLKAKSKIKCKFRKEEFDEQCLQL
jgi:hypothetical protein